MATYHSMSENESDSDLSDPPLSPKGPSGNPIRGEAPAFNVERASEIDDAVDDEEEISAYVPRKPEFDEQLEDDEVPAEVETAKDSRITEKIRSQFPDLISIEEFEEFLRDPEDMSYEKLYNRTAAVSKALAAYQTEFEAIDTEVTAYEAFQKAQKERADELAKEDKARRLLEEDAQRAKIAEIYRFSLELEGREWEHFLADLEKRNPPDDTTLTHLQNLKDPIFMNQVHNRQKKMEKERQKQNQKPQKPPLINAPLPEYKATKEEKRVQSKRRLGCAIDPVIFEDRKMADVYGFEWSSKEEHVGDQPLEKVAASRSNLDGATGRSSRLPRQQNRKRYDDEDAHNTEAEELPAKRTVKPRSFINDDVEAPSRHRAQSRDANHPVKLFPSGKRVGRPPAKSKLQNVQHALSPSLPALAPTQEAELHDAAEALVNQTVTDQAAAGVPVLKKKHAGGRPKKIVAGQPDGKLSRDGLTSSLSITNPFLGAEAVEQLPSAATVKHKHAGGRPKKKPVGVEDAVEKMIADLAPLKNLNNVPIEPPIIGNAALSVPAKRKHAGGRPKKNIAPFSSAGPSSAAPSVESVPKAKARKKIARKMENIMDFDSEPEPAVSQPVTDSGMDSGPTTSASASRSASPSSGRSSTSSGNAISTRRSIKAKRKNAPNTISDVVTEEPSSSASSTGRMKQSTKEPNYSSTQVVGRAPVGFEYLAAPAPAKKRKARAIKQEVESLEASPEPSSSQASRPKRKRTITAESSTIVVADPYFPGRSEVASAAKKRKPATTPSSSAPDTVSKPRKRDKPPMLAPRAPSTRVRKPSRALLGLDGADDQDQEELEQQFRSEYDHFQALSSPKNPVSLGKRNRKPVIDLAAAMHSEDDEEEENYY